MAIIFDIADGKNALQTDMCVLVFIVFRQERFEITPKYENDELQDELLDENSAQTL